MKFVAIAISLLATGPAHHHRPGCPKTYTPEMGFRAARAIYSGTGPVTRQQLLLLGRIEKCQRYKKRDQPRVRNYDRRLDREHAARREAALTPWRGPAIASWYNDAGTTGCGFHATYGIATFVVGCGGRVRLRNPSTGAVVTAIRDDSGPYIGGRTFDLNPATKAVLGCGDLCTVDYAPGG